MKKTITGPRDREAMLNPRTWPSWPLLPLKNPNGRRPGEFPKLAVLAEASGPDAANPDIRFVEGSMFGITGTEIAAAPKADVDRLLRDGWVID